MRAISVCVQATLVYNWFEKLMFKITGAFFIGYWVKMAVTHGTQTSFYIFRYALMKSCWVVRPKDRPSFKDVVVSIRDLLYPHGEDESDQGIESDIEETSFSRPGKHFPQAATPDDRPVTHLRDEDSKGQNVWPFRDEEQELQTSSRRCHGSQRNEYLVIVESPKLLDCDWIPEVNQISIADT